MAAMTEVTTSTELYPVRPDEGTRRLVDELATTERDEAGRMLSRRPLTVIERQMLVTRIAELSKAVEPATNKELRDAVAQMLSGFPGESDPTAARAVVAQYVTVLKGLPAFAVRRACLKFARGEVSAEDVGMRRDPRGFAPATDLVRIVSEREARQMMDEHHVVGMLYLSAPMRPEPSPEERARVVEKFADLLWTLKRTAESEDERRRREDSIKNRDGLISETGAKLLIDEYRRVGLEPIFRDDGKTPVSLDTLRRLGWRVERGADGKPVLTAPAKTG